MSGKNSCSLSVVPALCGVQHLAGVVYSLLPVAAPLAPQSQHAIRLSRDI